MCLSVSESVTQNELHERSTDRYLQPIFTKLATNVESQEVYGYLLFLLEIRNISIRQTGSGINPYQLLLWKNIFNVKYLENGERYDMSDSKEVR